MTLNEEPHLRMPSLQMSWPEFPPPVDTFDVAILEACTIAVPRVSLNSFRMVVSTAFLHVVIGLALEQRQICNDTSAPPMPSPRTA